MILTIPPYDVESDLLKHRTDGRPAGLTAGRFAN
jgi:hypothetical protein